MLSSNDNLWETKKNGTDFLISSHIDFHFSLTEGPHTETTSTQTISDDKS